MNPGSLVAEAWSAHPCCPTAEYQVSSKSASKQEITESHNYSWQTRMPSRKQWQRTGEGSGALIEVEHQRPDAGTKFEAVHSRGDGQTPTSLASERISSCKDLELREKLMSESNIALH